MSSIDGIQLDADNIDGGMLEGLTLAEAANAIAAVITPLNPSPEQREAFISDVRNGITGCAAAIHHEICGRVVEVEIDDDELHLIVDGQEIAWYLIDDIRF